MKKPENMTVRQCVSEVVTAITFIETQNEGRMSPKNAKRIRDMMSRIANVWDGVASAVSDGESSK